MDCWTCSISSSDPSLHNSIPLHNSPYRCTLLYIGCTPLTFGYWGTYTIIFMYTTPLTDALFCILVVLHSHWGIEVHTILYSCTLFLWQKHSLYIGLYFTHIGVLMYIQYYILVHYSTHRSTLLYIGLYSTHIGVLRYIQYYILVHYSTHRRTLLYIGLYSTHIGVLRYLHCTVHCTLYFSLLNVPFLPSADFNPCLAIPCWEGKMTNYRWKFSFCIECLNISINFLNGQSI